MKKNHLLFFLLTILSLYLTSCTKTGPQGPAGTNGANGANGTNGIDGNASVFTDTLTVESTEWANGGVWAVNLTPGASVGYSTKYYDVPFDEVTSGIIDSGMVSVYIAPDVGGEWLQLPYSVEGSSVVNFVYTVTPGNVRLQFFLLPVPLGPFVDVNNYTPATYDFKIVAVAGNLSLP